MTDLPIFFGNKVGPELIVVRADAHPRGTRASDVLGDGAMPFRAPDSERARSMLGVHLSKIGAVT